MVILSLTFVVIAIVTGLLISKHRYNTKLKNLSKSTSTENKESIQLSKELSRIDELKRNLVTVQRNVESLDFPLPEHQNIRKAVLCVLPKEFCVRRSGKDPMIQGLRF